jgi:hypothetical protein
MLTDEEIRELKKTGLLISNISAGPYEGGYSIAKPKPVPGNSRKDWEVFLGAGKIECDGPIARVFFRENKWIFQVWESIPGPGPGDFQEKYDSASEAFVSVLDYYFGDPSKMNPPELLED